MSRIFYYPALFEYPARFKYLALFEYPARFKYLAFLLSRTFWISHTFKYIFYRKAIKEFKIVREDMEKLKTTQKDLRDRRDLMFKERGDLKRKEEEAKVEIRDLRDSIEEMKIKIETFAAEKRNAMTEYRIQEMAHKKFITDKREEAKMKRREEKEAAEAQKMKEW